MYTYRASRHLHSFPTRRSSDLGEADVLVVDVDVHEPVQRALLDQAGLEAAVVGLQVVDDLEANHGGLKSRLVKEGSDRKSTRLNSSHVRNSYAVFFLKKKKNQH